MTRSISTLASRGVRGKAALPEYFRRLLKYNPDWVWTQLQAIPMQDGFLNKWRADIPGGAEVISIVGVCFVQLDDTGKIKRNEVYFDRSTLLTKIAAQRAR